MKRRGLRYLFIFICALIMLSAMSQASFADDSWNVESITFTPASDSVKMSKIMKADNDGPLKLDLAYRNDGAFSYCFFTSGDSCTVKYKDGRADKTFRFQKIINPQFARFREVGGSEEIELEALSTDISREIRNSVEGSADDLAAVIGTNGLQIEYGVYDPDTGLGNRVLCDCTITVKEDKAHDCRKALRSRNKNEPTCEASGFSRECRFCQICGSYYTDDDALTELEKSEVFLPAAGHDWKCEAKTTGTHVTETYRCQRAGCRESYVIEYDMEHFHDPLGYVREVPAACTRSGMREYGVCAVCGFRFDPGSGGLRPVTDAELIIPSLGHEWVRGAVTKQPTYTGEGIQEWTCSRCGETKETIIPAVSIGEASLGVSVSVPKRTASLSWEPVNNASFVVLSYRKAGSSKWKSRTVAGTNRSRIGKLKRRGFYEFKAAGAAVQDGQTIYGAGSPVIRRYINRVYGVRVYGRKKAVRVRWNRDSRATGYQLIYSTSKNMKDAKVVELSKKSRSYTIKKLSRGKRYYVKVRPVAKYRGELYTGSLSGVKSAKAR